MKPWLEAAARSSSTPETSITDNLNHRNLQRRHLQRRHLQRRHQQRRSRSADQPFIHQGLESVEYIRLLQLLQG